MIFILDRAMGKLKRWKQSSLSQAGREVLIKAVVQAIPAYTMACFSLSLYFYKRLSAYVRTFWWGENQLETMGICLQVEHGWGV